MTEEMQRVELSRFISENAYGYTQLMTESAQSNLTDVVLNKMLELTIGKYNKIDFSEIERSRGDVTKIKYYKNLEECINSLIEIHSVTNKIPSIIIVSDALNNLRTLKSTFEYNFRIKNSAAIMIYNTIMYGIMMAVSYIIAASISISKRETASNGAAKVKVYEADPKSMVIVNSLAAFNTSVADGTLMKFMKEAEDFKVQNESVEVMEEGIVGTGAELLRYGGNIAKSFAKGGKANTAMKSFAGTKAGKIVIGAGAATGLLLVGSRVIPVIRFIIYNIYRCKQSISDAAALQARYMELNIESLKEMDSNAIAGRTKILHKPITSEELITKQTKWVDRFNSLSQKFALDSDKAARDTKIDIKEDRVDVSDIVL